MNQSGSFHGHFLGDPKPLNGIYLLHDMRDIECKYRAILHGSIAAVYFYESVQVYTVYIYGTHTHLPHIMHHVEDFKEQCLMLATKWQTRLTVSLLFANKAEGCGWLVTLNKCISLTGFIHLSLSQGRRRYMQGMIK